MGFKKESTTIFPREKTLEELKSLVGKTAPD